MKTTRKWLSVLLAFALVLSTLSMCFAASAEVDEDSVLILVPETIYLKPGTGEAQYYIATSPNGEDYWPSPSANKNGTYYFSCMGLLSSFSVTLSLASGRSGSFNVGSFASPDETRGSGTILRFSVPAGSDDLLVWTFNYEVNGVPYTSKAYSYIYAPYLGQTGAQGSFTYKTMIGNEPKLCVYSFLNGIHSTDGGPYASAFTGTSDDDFMSPMMEGWNSTTNVPPAGSNATLSGAESFFPEDDHGGVTYREEYRDRNGNTTGHNYGSAVGYGVLTVDTSRYAGESFDKIPNFTAGFYVFGSEYSSETHKLESFTATSSASTIVFASDVDYENNATGVGYYPYTPSGTIPSQDTNYTVTATYKMQRSSSSTVTMSYTFGLHVICVDKSALRQLIQTCLMDNCQAREFDAAAFEVYQIALQNASMILGKPDAAAAEIAQAEEVLRDTHDYLYGGQHLYTAQTTLLTCTTDATAVFTCTHCGKSFSFTGARATGHDYVLTSETPSVCNTPGHRIYTCTVCHTFKIETLPTVIHTYGPYTPVDDQTHERACVFCGRLVTGTHTFVEDTAQYVAPSETEDIPGERVYVCSKCEFTKREIVPSALHTEHTYTAVVTEPTCTEDGYTTYTCSGCGDAYTANETQPLGHDWNAGVVTAEPTTTSEGEMTYTCTRCGETYTEAIPPLEGVGEIVVEGCTTYAGMDVLVTVSLRQNPGIVATRLALSYDPNVLTLLEANRGDLPTGGSFTVSNNLNAVPFYIAWEDSLSTVDYTEDGIFAVFKFRVADNAPVGSTAVTVTYDAGSTYNTNLVDRTFTVLNGEVNVIQRISGDANGDFTLDLKDVTVLRRCLAGWEGYSIDQVCADYNGDGVVNLKDVTLIRRFLAGWTQPDPNSAEG